MPILHLREPVSALSHGMWLFLSLPATWLLWRKSGGDRAKRFTLFIFGLSLAFCYAGSALFHGVQLSPDGLEEFNRLDHIGIFVLIAGSYTPIAWNVLQGRWRWATIGLAWSSAVIGTVILLTIGILPLFWTTVFYLGMGWGALVCYFEMTRVLSHRALFPLVLGGIFYSVGAMLNLLNWPVLWNGVVGPHEVFHLFVMAGSFSHFWFMLSVVVTFTAATTQWRDEAERKAMASAEVVRVIDVS